MFLLLLIPTPIFLPEMYKTGFTLYSLSFQVTYIMENESGSERSGPQVMEHRPNSEPDTPSEAESPILSLTEHYILNRAINKWHGPKYVTYNTQETRLVLSSSTSGLTE